MNYNYFFLEIKNRVILLLITVFSILLVTYIYKETLVFAICYKSDFSFICTNVVEVFSLYLELLLFMMFQIFFSHLFLHLLVFVTPGLYKTEYYYMKFFFYSVNSFFIVFSLLFNLVFFPLSCEFFLSFQHLTFKSILNFHFEANIKNHIIFYFFLYKSCYIYSLIFAFLNLILYNVNLKSITITTFRKIFYILILFVFIFFSPLDFIGQFIFLFSIYSYFELVIFIFLLKNQLKICY